MTGIQNGYRPGPAEPYTPHKIEEVRDKSGALKSLVLQVKIEGRHHRVSLSTDVLRDFGLTGPAAAEELRGIRAALERLADLVEGRGRETG
ncbi:MAG: hypothetical protein OXI07_05100 [Gammaproteobacteria bacterium]|nr:hypothetical protein [Gammaproteobacteria bacterium]